MVTPRAPRVALATICAKCQLGGLQGLLCIKAVAIFGPLVEQISGRQRQVSIERDEGRSESFRLGAQAWHVCVHATGFAWIFQILLRAQGCDVWYRLHHTL